MPVDASTPLPDVTLRDRSLIVVRTGDPLCRIVALHVHVRQDIPAGDEDVDSNARMMFVPGTPAAPASSSSGYTGIH